MLEEDNNGRVAGDGDSSGGAIVVGDGDSDGGDEDNNGVMTDGGKNTVGRTAYKVSVQNLLPPCLVQPIIRFGKITMCGLHHFFLLKN